MKVKKVEDTIYDMVAGILILILILSVSTYAMIHTSTKAINEQQYYTTERDKYVRYSLDLKQSLNAMSEIQASYDNKIKRLTKKIEQLEQENLKLIESVGTIDSIRYQLKLSRIANKKLKEKVNQLENANEQYRLYFNE
jgi:SMC interacting uncharacterized protein involved in chromosome segregation